MRMALILIYCLALLITTTTASDSVNYFILPIFVRVSSSLVNSPSNHTDMKVKQPWGMQADMSQESTRTKITENGSPWGDGGHICGIYCTWMWCVYFIVACGNIPCIDSKLFENSTIHLIKCVHGFVVLCVVLTVTTEGCWWTPSGCHMCAWLALMSIRKAGEWVTTEHWSETFSCDE